MCSQRSSGMARQFGLSQGRQWTPGHEPHYLPEDRGSVYFTNDPGHAQVHADKAYARHASGSPHVYQVQPTGDYSEHYAIEHKGVRGYRSAAPLRVVRELPEREGGG